MLLKDISIRKKLTRVILLIISVVLVVTSVTFLVYEWYAYRKNTREKLSTVGKIVAANSTAALAFEDKEGAREILLAFREEPRIVRAALYNNEGKLFAFYSKNLSTDAFPTRLDKDGYYFIHSRLEGFEPVLQDKKRLGTLYMQSDQQAMYKRFGLLAFVMAISIILSLALTFILSNILQRHISKPILALADTARIISDQKDYTVRAVRTSRDEVGNLTEAFNTMLDEINKQNRKLNEFNSDLEQKVKNRTEQLEIANKELESFSYSISHDLRAPLRGIVGFATILEEDYNDKLDEEGKRILSVIKNNTLKMGRLIDDLLMFSRMSRQDIVRDTIDTNKMVRDVIAENVTGSNHINWVISDLPELHGDMNAVRQVWVNLVSNAIKYSSTQDHPQIEVSYYADAGSGQPVFFVRDNGVGFDEKYKDKLFNVFQRLHREEDFEGTGIGLAIVRKIVSKHGGKVWAAGQLNKGACFYFTIPQ
jgi:signal transduction histidine kinase